jgi:pimeloyl-ACP methyl ester carboxylesterase
MGKMLQLSAAAFLASIVAVYLVLMLLTLLTQRSVMYPAPRPADMPRTALGTLLVIEGSGHRRIHAFYVAARDSQPTVVIFHGNGEQLADQVPMAQDLADSGLGSYAIEYPGYGLSSSSRTTESNVYADAESALRHLEINLRVPRDQMVLFGRSLGTGVAAEMALRGYGSRIVMLSPYTSMRWLVLDRYDTIAKVGKIQQITLVIHGAIDSVVPCDMGKQVAKRLPAGRVLVVAGADHNDLLDVGGSSLWQHIVEFASADGYPVSIHSSPILRHPDCIAGPRQI